MTKHVILWKLREDLTAEEKQKVKAEAKAALEGLLGKIDGLSAITVNIEPLPSSNVDMMLDTTFTAPDALRGYSVHPAHVAVANTYVRPYTAVRSCFDYEI